MTSVTHFAFSYLVTSAVGAGPETALPASLASLLPDIDHPDSLIGRVFPGLSKLILRRWGHRTVTHSLFAIAVMALAFSPALLHSVSLYGALLLAYSSHIFIDLFNRSGVKLLAPVSQKEYISFKTPELRILVSSWKEYAFLFVIVVLAITVTGRSFSLSGAVRTLAKAFYKNYSTALDDYRNSSGFVSRAKISYFDHVSRSRVKGEFAVLNLFQDRVILLDRTRGDPRLVIKKDDIAEIEIIATESPLVARSISGSDTSLLHDIPAGAFVSGTITVNNFDPGLKSGEHITVTKGVDAVNISCCSALPSELFCIVELPRQVRAELERLKAELPENKKAAFLSRINTLRSQIALLNKKGFYAHYSEIMRYSDEAKGLQSRIDALNAGQYAGDDEVREKISRIENGFGVDIDVVWVEM